MKRQFILRMLVVAALLPSSFWGLAQTTRGDYDYDGQTTISDVATLIDYLLYGDWGEHPEGVQRDTIHIDLAGGYDIVMIHVDGGSYSMGEGITVTVGDFWIAETEVTQGLWKAVMEHKATYTGKYYPKRNISWNDCQEFIDELNALTGRTFRLPRSIEWGFAARGGNLSHDYIYAGSNNPLLVAWHSANSPSGPQDVGTLFPNELGLYDMSGNVNEWCQDTGSSSSMRIFRGGSYQEDASACRVTQSREAAASNSQLNVVGLRLAM